MAELIASPVLTYGLEQEAHFRAGKIKLENTGVSYILESKEEQIGIDLQVMGLFNVYNSLGAAALCAGQGVSLDRIKRGLESVPGVPGRFQRIPNRVGLNVVVDYAHTPTAWRTYSAPLGRWCPTAGSLWFLGLEVIETRANGPKWVPWQLNWRTL